MTYNWSLQSDLFYISDQFTWWPTCRSPSKIGHNIKLVSFRFIWKQPTICLILFWPALAWPRGLKSGETAQREKEEGDDQSMGALCLVHMKMKTVWNRFYFCVLKSLVVCSPLMTLPGKFMRCRSWKESYSFYLLNYLNLSPLCS